MLTIYINLNMIFYTHVQHSPTKTIYIKYYMEKQTHTHTPRTNTHTYTHTHYTHTHMHACMHTHTHTAQDTKLKISAEMRTVSIIADLRVNM